MVKVTVGIIGGSGLYRMNALENAAEHVMDTPYGRPSDALVSGTVMGVPVVFLARHGRSHHLIPTEVPYRANIHAMKQLGVRYLISLSAVGSLREHIAPLDMVLPDQFIDLTKHRIGTFFGNGAVAHASMAQPICTFLTDALASAVEALGPSDPVHLHRGGTYVCIEGPQFSSRAESNWYRAMGADIIGMTNMPEVKLAWEAQMAYATLAMVTDYDCWQVTEAPVAADLAMANLARNAARAQQIVVAAISRIGKEKPDSSAHQALASALVTPWEAMPPVTRVALGIFED